MLGSGGLFATGATLASMGGKATESLMEDAPCSYLLPSCDLSLRLGASKRGGYTTLCDCFSRLQIQAVTPICSSMNLHNDSYLPCLLAPSSKQRSHEGRRQVHQHQEIFSAEGEPQSKRRKIKTLGSMPAGSGEASVLLLLT